MTWIYKAPRWLPGGDLQTIFSAKFAKRYKRTAPVWTRERWQTPDQDFVDVDWLNVCHQGKDAAPLLVLFHGLEGSSSSHYAQAFSEVARENGWLMAVPHFRGCSGEINLAPRAYHSGDFVEIGWLLETFKARHKGEIYAAGISLGGNALMKWASEMGSTANNLVRAVASVCSPIDLTASGHTIDKGFNRLIYAHMFLSTMKPRAMAKLKQYPKLFDPDKLKATKTLYEFDNVFTAPLHGFKNTDDYWKRASAKPGLNLIKIPALVLNALNDPFIPASCLPKKKQVSDSVELWQPSDGGHVGFASAEHPSHLLQMPEAVLNWMKNG